MKMLEKYGNEVYAVMRIVAGFMFAFHGFQKVLGILAEFQPAIGSQLWIGGVIELVGGLLIMVGFQTRWAGATMRSSRLRSSVWLAYHQAA